MPLSTYTSKSTEERAFINKLGCALRNAPDMIRAEKRWKNDCIMIMFKNTRTRNTCILRDERNHGGNISIICYDRLPHRADTIVVDHVVSSSKKYHDLSNEDVVKEVAKIMTKESYFSNSPFRKVNCTLDRTRVTPDMVFAAKVANVTYGFIDGVFKMLISFDKTDYVYRAKVEGDMKTPANPFGMYMVIDINGESRFFVESKFNMFFEYE